MGDLLTRVKVEVQADGEATWDGRALVAGADFAVPVDERLLEKRVNLEWQHCLICELGCLIARLHHVLNDSLVRSASLFGKVTPEQAASLEGLRTRPGAARTAVEFRAELEGNGDVLLNDRTLETSTDFAMVDEALVGARVPPKLQREVIRRLDVLLARLDNAYKRRRVKEGELIEEQGKLRPSGRKAFEVQLNKPTFG